MLVCTLSPTASIAVPGGVLMYGIPEFRLPKTIMQKEIDTLKDLGVEFVLNFVVGRSEEPSTSCSVTVTRRGYLCRLGAGLPTFIGVPGENARAAFTHEREYLTRINLMKAYKENADTPIYHAKSRCCRRRLNYRQWTPPGAQSAWARTRFTSYTAVPRKELPARLEEIHHAKEEALSFPEFLTAPLEGAV